MRPSGLPIACRVAGSAALSIYLAACSAPREQAIEDSGRLAGDTAAAAAPRRIASDATLQIYDAVDVAGPLRAVADSFAAREAMNVVADAAPSAEVVRKVTEPGAVPDIIALTDIAALERLIPAQASWYVVFAQDRVVLAYQDSSRGAAKIDSTNWWKTLQQRRVRVGRVDPTRDPKGVDPLLVMQLAESHYRQPRLATRLRAGTPSAQLYPSDTALLDALRADSIDYAWTHESAARAAEVRYLRLPEEIDLGSLADSALYAAAEVAIPGASPEDTVRVRGAPIVYGISIPNAAPSPRYAERFLRFLFSDAGRRVLEAGHLDVLSNPIIRGPEVPPSIVSIVGAAAAVDSTATADSLAPAPSSPDDTAATRKPASATPERRARP
jgi:molybdate/tungstate transport system substrate-binding protein